MEALKNILITDYDYELPHEKIALYPLEDRALSKMLVFKNDNLTETSFKNIKEYLPANSLLVFNESKVIHARIKLKKQTGADIEILCLEPTYPTTEIQNSFSQTSPCKWKVFIGNAKRWKTGTLEKKLHSLNDIIDLKVEQTGKFEDSFEVEFRWTPQQITFSEILEAAGQIPLPPYINRQPEIKDNDRYQTVYAKNEGSVAAPTAGLHFTKEIIDELTYIGVDTSAVTLHVGAGTFKPVTAEQVQEHEMHTEQIDIKKETIEKLLSHTKNETKIIAVGTTSVRTLESLYHFGNKLDKNPESVFDISQWDPYNAISYISREKSLETVLQYMNRHNLDSIQGKTQMLIGPGYNYNMIDGMLTNFHQPKSTLLLLVSAFIGEYWREIYKYALNNNFRFLSYGDCCLFLK